tara:strand:+ start:146 stop:733 length:588 start_codon:yes stop_codon:yes gene_type:complete
MKRLIVMRHGFLQSKYGDYTKLCFKDYEDLLLKKVSPKVDTQFTKNKLQDKGFLKNVNLVFCSEQSRGIETAKILSDLYGFSFQKTSLLNEVDFKEGVISLGDEKDYGFLRKKILSSIYFSNDFELIKRRVLEFIEIVRKLDEEKVLAVSHGWLMRFFYIYSLRGNLDSFSLNDLLLAKAAGFLDSFEIILEENK